MSEHRKPDFILWITEKNNTASRTAAGAVWFKEVDGKNGKFRQASIRLNPGVVIDWRVAEDCFITLKPPGPDAKTKAASAERGGDPEYEPPF